MAGATTKKRSRDEKAARPSKKQKRQTKPQREASDDEGFQAVDLMASDSDDIHNAVADDAASDDDGMLSSDDEAAAPTPKKSSKATTTSSKVDNPKRKAKPAADKSDADEASEADDNASSEAGEDEFGSDDLDSGSDDEEMGEQEEDNADDTRAKSKSKRNDPSAFSTSMSKILSTKLPTSKRADPVLARSAAAQESARVAADTALEQKARRHLRLQKKEAQEKGRVRDVLIATRDDILDVAGGQSTGEMLESERRLRKVAQRGVVKLFNAVRAAQVKAAEADRATRKQGVVGASRKEAKVNEMSKKGFLDLIASGGGGLNKKPIEEA